MVTTAHLHAEADAAAQRGDFRSALANSAEILATLPSDHRARLKVGLCLAALGRGDDAASALLVVARGLARSGFPLAAIGACRDALATAGGRHPAVVRTLEQIHESIHERHGDAVRVPPPIVPVELDPSGPRGFVATSPDLVERARSLALSDPAPGGRFESEPAPFFSDLRREVFLDLVPRMRFHKVGADQGVFAQGDPGRSLFIVVSGEVEVSRAELDAPPFVLARLGAGQLFGELSLLTQKPRAATVRTLRPTELFEIDRSAIERVAAEHPRVLDDLIRFARRRLLENLLITSPVFRPLGEEARVEVVKRFETRVVKGGDVLIEEGTDPIGLFLVLEGELEVTKKDAEGDTLVLAYLREGEVAGEVSLVEDGPTSATVRATDRAVLLHLPRDRFRSLVADFPELSTYLDQLVLDRVEENERVAEDQAELADGLVLM